MGGFVAVTLGVTGLKFLFWFYCFSLLHFVRSADIWIGFCEWGSKLTVWHGCLDGRSHFVLHFQKGFHFLYDIGMWTYVVCPWYTFGYLHGLIPFVPVGP